MIRSLLWKEWLEHRWRAALGCMLMGGFAWICLRTRLLADDEAVLATVWLASVLVSLLVAMGLVAAERGTGELRGLLALPVRPVIVFAVKTIVALAAVLLPMAVAAAVAVATAGGRELATGRMLQMFAFGAAMAVSCLLWGVALGIRQPSEARVAVLAVAVPLVWFFLFYAESPKGILQRALVDTHPYILGMIDRRPRSAVPAILAVQIMTWPALWAWAAWRFPKPTRSER